MRASITPSSYWSAASGRNRRATTTPPSQRPHASIVSYPAGRLASGIDLVGPGRHRPWPVLRRALSCPPRRRPLRRAALMRAVAVPPAGRCARPPTAARAVLPPGHPSGAVPGDGSVPREDECPSSAHLVADWGVSGQGPPGQRVGGAWPPPSV